MGLKKIARLPSITFDLVTFADDNLMHFLTKIYS